MDDRSVSSIHRSHFGPCLVSKCPTDCADSVEVLMVHKCSEVSARTDPPLGVSGPDFGYNPAQGFPLSVQQNLGPLLLGSDLTVQGLPHHLRLHEDLGTKGSLF